MSSVSGQCPCPLHAMQLHELHWLAMVVQFPVLTSVTVNVSHVTVNVSILLIMCSLVNDNYGHTIITSLFTDKTIIINKCYFYVFLNKIKPVFVII